MSDVLFAWGGVHPRTLIRRAVCQVMREHDGLAALIGARIWPNRMEHWFRGELPAAGVYTVSEQRVESDTRPEPQERVISLAVELLGGELEAVDDTLDALCLQAVRHGRGSPLGFLKIVVKDVLERVILWTGHVNMGVKPAVPLPDHGKEGNSRQDRLG